MRLATFNMLHGRSVQDGAVDPDRVAAAVAAIDADVLGLQEVDRDLPRSGQVDLTAVAAAALGAAGYRFAATLVGTPGQRHRAATAADPGGPAYGIALVSRWPVRRWAVLRLPSVPMWAPVLLPGAGGGLVLLRDEPRVLLAAVVDGPAGVFTVATTHLSFVPGWNVVQLRAAIRALRRLPGPRVLLGDLNLPAAVLRAVTRWRPLARLATYPAEQPRVQFDHVLAEPGTVARLGEVRAASAPQLPVSDHRPLVVWLAPPV